uniref:Ig-like domain-containing protein n=1 Tax=Electrophorus electricus TaxID=8005 RepID=A0AAY5F593_ELEEL
IDDVISCTFINRDSIIAQLVNRKPSTHYDEIFRNRLQLDTQTGALTIHNITESFFGNVLLSTVVSFSAMLPVPNITRASHSETKSSVSLTCPVLCSVDSVNKVTLSWYKGNHVLSTISDSNTSSCFLPLEVEYHDNNTYSCVAANLVSNQTAHNQSCLCFASCLFCSCWYLVLVLVCFGGSCLCTPRCWTLWGGGGGGTVTITVS